jgi:hypothetical protein
MGFKENCNSDHQGNGADNSYKKGSMADNKYKKGVFA